MAIEFVASDIFPKKLLAANEADARRVLHVGCGPINAQKLHQIFRNPGWEEVRVDIDPRVKPDIVASIVDLNPWIKNGTCDAVWSSHNLEHLDTFEVPRALAEFARVLLPTGFALITCPDLEAIAQKIVDGDLENNLYLSRVGPITPLDVLFGHGRSIQRGNAYMRHHTGFTEERLGNLLIDAGFDEVRILKGEQFDLWALARMPECRDDEIGTIVADR